MVRVYFISLKYKINSNKEIIKLIYITIFNRTNILIQYFYKIMIKYI